MNEQDIINRLARIEKMLEDISARLPAQPSLARPHNWPWGYRLASVNMECGAAGSNADQISSMGANGGVSCETKRK